MTKLPLKISYEMMLTTWGNTLNRFLGNPTLHNLILKDVSLTTGSNVINHKLGRKLQGWSPTRIKGASATFYDEQDTNPTPELTLVLVSSANVTIDLEVY